MAMPKQPQREIAMMLGESTYFTGKPCKSGHIERRHVTGNGCLGCMRVFKEGYRQQARDYRKSRRDVELLLDPVNLHNKEAAWRRGERVRHPERVRARERINGRIKRQRYPQVKLAETRARQAAKLQRTPPWADLKAIRRFYEACPPGMEVDHIVPLKGKTVSGLHVLENLQYLTPFANKQKGNRFDG